MKIINQDCIKNLKNIKINKYPFRHITLNNFLNEDYSNKLNNIIINMKDEEANESWIRPKSKNEFNKYGFSEIDELDSNIRTLFDELNSKEFIELLEDKFEIKNIIKENRSLLGAGVHRIKDNGFLSLHTDFNMYEHPQYGFIDRRLNLLLYMNKDWEDSFNGHLLLCDKDKKKIIKKIKPNINNCIIFETTNKSIHGHPLRLSSNNRDRNSIAVYYYTKNENNGETDFEGDNYHKSIWYDYNNFESI